MVPVDTVRGLGAWGEVDEPCSGQQDSSLGLGRCPSTGQCRVTRGGDWREAVLVFWKSSRDQNPEALS